MWQKDPLSKRDSALLSGIESGRISANGTWFGAVFHANPIRVFYGLFREGAGSGSGNPGPYRARFYPGDRTSRDLSGGTDRQHFDLTW